MTYSTWSRRALALVLDALPVVGLAVLALILMWATRIRMCDGDTSALDLAAQCGSNVSPLGVVGFVVGWLATVGYGVWNFGVRQGRTGSSIGKSVLGLRVVDGDSLEPIGFWRSVIRQLVHAADLLSLGVGYLWPMWDARKQTFADKLASTICVSGTH